MALTDKQERFCEEYVEHKDFYVATILSNYRTRESYGNLYYVYFLVNPLNNEIFYVGKGKGRRSESHLKENISGNLINAHKHKVINEIISRGLKPQIKVFLNDLGESNAYDIERILIKKFRKLITNFSSGVVCKHEKNKQWAISALRRAKPFNVWVKEKSRSKDDIKLFKEVRKILEDIASGNKKLYDTLKITTRNGFNCVEVD